MLHTDLIAPVPELLRRHAGQRGSQDRVSRRAVASVTYADLFERTGNLAGHLADIGVAPGETVAIMLPNSVQWVEACFGITRAGAIGVPISYDSTEPEIAYRLADANCTAIFTTAERADLFAGCCKGRAQSYDRRSSPIAANAATAHALSRPDRHGAEVGAARPAADARARLHPLHVRHHRPRQGRHAHCARHAVGHGRLLGADHRPCASATRCCRRCRCSIPMR